MAIRKPVYNKLFRSKHYLRHVIIGSLVQIGSGRYFLVYHFFFFAGSRYFLVTRAFSMSSMRRRAVCICLVSWTPFQFHIPCPESRLCFQLWCYQSLPYTHVPPIERYKDLIKTNYMSRNIGAKKTSLYHPYPRIAVQ